MKKHLILTTLIMSMVMSLFTACASNIARENMDEPTLVNAENYGGITLQTSADTTVKKTTAQSTTTAAESTTTEPEPNMQAELGTTKAETFTEPAVTTEIKVTEKTTASDTTAATTKATTKATTAATTTSATTTTTTTKATTTTSAATAGTQVNGQNSYTAMNFEEVKGVWISYLELGGILMDKSKSSFTTSIGEMFDNCARMGINTVFVHARAFGDAFYYSELFPFSKYASGTIGTRLSYDPLEIMVEQAHTRGLSFHAWINPLRLGITSDMMKLDNSTQIGQWFSGNKNSYYIVQYGNNWYLNPAYPEVRQLIADGAKEIVMNYDVDGLHIDDYFYPTTDSWFDSSAFGESGEKSLADFRFANINALVLGLNKGVKSVNSSVWFGISPQGSIENNIDYLYADVKTWCADKAYCDYIVPQIYYGFDNLKQPYETCLSNWASMTSGSGVKLITGLAAYKVGRTDEWAGDNGKSEWVNNHDILSRQIEYAQGKKAYGGFAFFSYNYLFGAESNTNAMTAEKAAISNLS